MLLTLLPSSDPVKGAAASQIWEVEAGHTHLWRRWDRVSPSIWANWIRREEMEAIGSRDDYDDDAKIPAALGFRALIGLASGLGKRAAMGSPDPSPVGSPVGSRTGSPAGSWFFFVFLND